jgi:uncharacterized membrane protein YczE
MSIGSAIIVVGAAIVVFVAICGEKIGLGTIVNMVLIGVFIDLIFMLNIIPLAANLIIGIVMLIAGLFIISAGSYFYIKSAFGAGPRDNLMVVLKRKTKMSTGICRSTVELSVTLTGWLLGGMVGIGTVITVFAIGFCIQITFAIFKFDVTAVKHETLKQTYNKLIKNS